MVSLVPDSAGLHAYFERVCFEKRKRRGDDQKDECIWSKQDINAPCGLTQQPRADPAAA